MADLGHAPPLQPRIFEEEKHGNRNNSGKTGNRSPPNLLALSQYYMERKVVAHNSKNKPFKVVLIGLDGTIKYTKNSPISAKNLFTIIDGMPMRRSKMNTN